MSLPIVIDIEASGFGAGSYPIEIGFVLADGNTHCRLIKPHETWTHWSESAEKIHEISRQTLFESGNDIEEIANWLNSLFRGKTVFSDAWGHDMSWLGKLFDMAGVRQHFRLEGLNTLLDERMMKAWNETKTAVEKSLALTRHRASNDARIIQLTYKSLLEK